MRLFLTLIGFFAFSSEQTIQASPSSAPPSKVHSTISFDTSYSENHYNNPQLRQFGLELMDVQAFVADRTLVALSQHSAVQAVARIASLAVNYWIAESFSHAYHELGHATRFRAAKVKYTFLNASLQPIGPNFFKLFLVKIGETGGAVTMQRSFPGKQDRPLGIDTPQNWFKHCFSFWAAGLNNDMYFSEYLGNQTFERGGHWTYFRPYLKGKLSALNYPFHYGPSNDVGVILEFYRSWGHPISKSDIDRANIISLITSANTYTLGHSYVNFLLNGETSPVKSWTPFGFRLPETSAYLNAKGISYRVATGYIVNDQWTLDLAYERIAHGRRQDELTLGFTHKATYWEDAIIKAALITGQGSSVETSLMIPLAKHIQIGGGVSHYDFRNLIGERNIPTLKNGKTAEIYWARLSIVY